MSRDLHDRPPILIVGSMGRSGTNFLTDLIALHPDCGHPQAIHEHRLFDRAHLLANYAEYVSGRWRKMADGAAGVPDVAEILEGIGTGLLQVLRSRVGHDRLVTKSPVSVNLNLHFQLFPHSQLLIIVRDGRAVVESYLRSGFAVHGPGDRFTAVVRNWAAGANRVLEFRRSHPIVRYSYMLVRYEDLFRDTQDRMRAILDFLGLDASVYDFERARNLPVRGSSFFFGPDARKMHWNPVERPLDFHKEVRWASWTGEQHRVFNAIAGPAMLDLGYDLVDPREVEPKG